MFKDVQSGFVQLGDGVDPQTIPKHYGAYYDEAGKMYRKFGCFKGLDDLHPNFWPLICLIADQAKRIDELEAAVLELQKHDLARQLAAPIEIDVSKQRGRPRLKPEAQTAGV